MLMLMLPFPYIATTAGWMTAELGASRGSSTA
jgi:cytochrome bd-type quinol oxidase subunit 1